MRAYDLSMLHHSADRSNSNCHGWCFGLPPGITPEQWPLDLANGYPLQHGFTLLLPEDYRCHGPEIVAVAFFASPFDLNDGGPRVKAPLIREAMEADGAPDDPDLIPFWQAERNAHPRLHRMKDILRIGYAAILLTQSEFDGPFCELPRMTANPYRDRLPPPAWMEVGSVAAYWGFQGQMRFVQDALGTEPLGDLAENRALGWTARANDPNAGRKPYDEFDHEPTDYIQPMYEAQNEQGETVYKDHEWAENQGSNHIGGTMRPVQSVPDFSPYYVEFNEEFGGYNFGDGNAQLDILDMKFDWACG